MLEATVSVTDVVGKERLWIPGDDRQPTSNKSRNGIMECTEYVVRILAVRGESLQVGLREDVLATVLVGYL